MILRLLNWQAIAGIALSLALGILLAVQKGETRHWRKQSAGFELRYDQTQAALSQTVANARAAADAARAADRANAVRVASEQRVINQRSLDAYQSRLSNARAVAQRLRDSTEAGTDPGDRRSASMPGLPTAARGAAQAAGQDRLSVDERQVATEQAIQLDELIKWIMAQAKVDANSNTGSTGEFGPR